MERVPPSGNFASWASYESDVQCTSLFALTGDSWMANVRGRDLPAVSLYKATGHLRAVQILLGYSAIENTVRYLGVDVEDALALAEATKI